jgi:hypothetical protein
MNHTSSQIRSASLAVAGTIAGATFALSPAAAEPYPWHERQDLQTSSPSGLNRAQIEYHERLATADTPTSTTPVRGTNDVGTAAGIPWALIGFAALGAAALGVGVLAVHSTPTPRPTP